MENSVLILQSVYKPFTYPIWKALKENRLIIIQSIELHNEPYKLARKLILRSTNNSKQFLTPIIFNVNKYNTHKKTIYPFDKELIDCSLVKLELEVVPTDPNANNKNGIVIINFIQFPGGKNRKLKPLPELVRIDLAQER